ncbi:MAG: GTP cyclohydrolase MptA [Candidatus Thermoplasmatota archaeon]
MNDVQNMKPRATFMLNRVGVTGVKKPVSVRRQGRVITLTVETDMFVDLPATQKGSHMSRNVEVLDEAVADAFKEPAPGLEHMAAAVARALLSRHEYATRAEVRMEADYFLRRNAPSGRETIEPYRLTARAIAYMDGGKVRLNRTIGVVVTGMTTCPCAMEGIRAMVRDRAAESPAITHNQRNITTLTIDGGEGIEVEADDLIDIVEGALSSPTYEILKRGDEAAIVLRAHENPKFVEDVVRDILGAVLERYSTLPGDTLVTVKSESQESIHKHNAFAERVTTLRELKA